MKNQLLQHKILKSNNLVVIGVFLLIFASNMQLVFGNIAKYIFLLLGFFLVFVGGIKYRFHLFNNAFVYLSILIYILYLYIGVSQNHNTFEPLNLAFSVICLILLNIGYLIGRSNEFSFYLKPKWIILFSLLSLLTVLFYYLNQAMLLDFRIRNFEDEGLNAVGLAYINGLVLLFYFVLFQNSQDIITKICILIGVFSAIFILLSTMSRGVLVYLSFCFILFYMGQLKFRLITFFNMVLYGSVVITVLSILYTFNEYFQVKTDGVIERFINISDHSSGAGIDYSTLAREEYLENFYNKLTEYFYGMSNYNPYPHNQIVEIILRWGIFGLPLLLLSISSFFKAFVLFKKDFLLKNQLFFLIIILFIFSYLQSMTSLSLEMNRFLWLGFGMISGFSVKSYYIFKGLNINNS